MKKITALLVLLPTSAFAHTGSHTPEMLESLHFLTQGDHIAMIIAGIIAIGFVTKKLVFVKK